MTRRFTVRGRDVRDVEMGQVALMPDRQTAVAAARLMNAEPACAPDYEWVTNHMEGCLAEGCNDMADTLEGTCYAHHRPTGPVHWVGEAPTSLHGNGAASFDWTTRDAADVTCSLCLTLLDRESTAPDYQCGGHVEFTADGTVLHSPPQDHEDGSADRG